MKSEYTKRVLMEGGNPTIWLSELDRMKKRLKDMKHPIDETDYLTDIIGKLPLKYRSEKKDFQQKLLDETLTLTYIRDELKDAYEAYYDEEERKQSTNKEGEDIALITGGGFKGTCRNCGKYGHKAADCPDKSGNGNNSGTGQVEGKRKFFGNCYLCGKRGH